MRHTGMCSHAAARTRLDTPRLADEDLKVVLGDPGLPAGKCAIEILSRAGVSVTPVSLEENVKSVVTKVALGEADAGMAWVSEIGSHVGEVEAVPLPDAQNLVEAFPIAVAKGSEHLSVAQEFVDYVPSETGQRIEQEKPVLFYGVTIAAAEEVLGLDRFCHGGH